MNGHRTIKCGVGIVIAILTLGACTTLDPYTGEEKVSNASKGAAIGAASGVAIGLITTHFWRAENILDLRTV